MNIGQKPSIGRIVHYTLSEGDVARINDLVPQSDHPGHIRRNTVSAGEVYPAMVVRVFNGMTSSNVNLQVFLDGAAAYWATSRTEGPDAGCWAWPARV